MSIRKKILATSIGPVLVLGVITLLFMLTMVKSSLMDEVQDALKGTLPPMTRIPGIIWKVPMAISGREATTYPNRKIWWTGSKKIPEWM
jgi:hypothetical protein